jgi:hypothetical protein
MNYTRSVRHVIDNCATRWIIFAPDSLARGYFDIGVLTLRVLIAEVRTVASSMICYRRHDFSVNAG